MSKKGKGGASDPGYKYEAVIDWSHYAPAVREEELRLNSVSVAEMYWQVVAPVRRQEIGGNRNREALMKDHGPFSHIRRAGTLPPPKPPKPDAVSKPVERIVRWRPLALRQPSPAAPLDPGRVPPLPPPAPPSPNSPLSLALSAPPPPAAAAHPPAQIDSADLHGRDWRRVRGDCGPEAQARRRLVGSGHALALPFADPDLGERRDADHAGGRVRLREAGRTVPSASRAQPAAALRCRGRRGGAGAPAARAPAAAPHRRSRGGGRAGGRDSALQEEESRGKGRRRGRAEPRRRASALCGGAAEQAPRPRRATQRG